MHYPFSVIALRRDQRTEGRETRKASTPTGPGRDAIAKSVMVYTAAPPDYCDNDVSAIVQNLLSGVNSLQPTTQCTPDRANRRIPRRVGTIAFHMALC